MYEEELFTNTITSYAINPSKQTFNELTLVHTHICIYTVKQNKSDPTIHVQCHDLECQNNTSNHKLQPILQQYVLSNHLLPIIIFY